MEGRGSQEETKKERTEDVEDRGRTSGRSTSLSGILIVSEGKIYYKGRDLKEREKVKRQTNKFVYVLIPKMIQEINIFVMF